jgi:hypothetical protein
VMTDDGTPPPAGGESFDRARWGLDELARSVRKLHEPGERDEALTRIWFELHSSASVLNWWLTTARKDREHREVLYARAEALAAHLLEQVEAIDPRGL